MNMLAIDTAAEFCAACILDTTTGRERGREAPEIGKGHAERLMAVIAEALRASGLGYADLGAIAVSVGPGSFTGIRIGVAAARGLALALKIPSIGVTTLEAIAFEARAIHAGRPLLAVLDAKRDELYGALYAPDGAEEMAPAILTAEQAAAMAAGRGAVLAGSGADLVAAARPETNFTIAGRGRTADIAAFAGLAARKGTAGPRPQPLYLRGADARPQSGFALPRKPAS